MWLRFRLPPKRPTLALPIFHVLNEGKGLTIWPKHVALCLACAPRVARCALPRRGAGRAGLGAALPPAHGHPAHVAVPFRLLGEAAERRCGDDVLEGAVPVRQTKLVAARMELHRDELLADGELAAGGHQQFKIEPLG